MSNCSSPSTSATSTRPSTSTPSCSPPSPPSASPATPTSPSPIRRSSSCSSRAPRAAPSTTSASRPRPPAEVEAAEARLTDTGLETTGIDDTICCYATKVETWVADPDGARWEWYVKTGDSDQLTNEIVGAGETAVCCTPAADEPVAVGAVTEDRPGCS